MKNGFICCCFLSVISAGVNRRKINRRGKDPENVTTRKPQDKNRRTKDRRLLETHERPQKAKTAGKQHKSQKAVYLIGARLYRNIALYLFLRLSAIFRKSCFLRFLRLLRHFKYVKNYFQKIT